MQQALKTTTYHTHKPNGYQLAIRFASLEHKNCFKILFFSPKVHFICKLKDWQMNSLSLSTDTRRATKTQEKLKKKEVCHLQSKAEANDLYAHTVLSDRRATTWELTLYTWISPVVFCSPAWLLTIANKDPFKSTEAGLLTSNDANKTLKGCGFRDVDRVVCPFCRENWS